MRRARRLLLAVTISSSAAIGPPMPAHTATTGNLADAQTRFAPWEIAWEDDLCAPSSPVSFVPNVLIGVGLNASQIGDAVTEIGGDLVADFAGPYGSHVFRLGYAAPAAAATAAMRGHLRVDLGLAIEFDHVFFLSPHWRLRPERAVERDDIAPPAALATGAPRPVVVIDSGYPDTGPEPPYDLAPDTRTAVDRRSPTALHGPFIASQIQQLLDGEGDVTLRRILTETGELPPPSDTTAEEVFDELALLNTLDAAAVGTSAAVVNLSLGTYGCIGDGGSEPLALRHAIETEVAAGATFVAAAGNDESDGSFLPAAYSRELDTDAIISVGATEPERNGVRRACFSNFGVVDLWAPGSDVWGRIPTATGFVTAAGSGTSFAAPYATAARAAFPGATEPYPEVVVDADGTASAGGSPCSKRSDDPCGRPTALARRGFLGSAAFGTDGLDVLVGTAGPDLMLAFGGDDVLCGLGGDDRLEGGDGSDVLVGGDGRDLLDGGAGPDHLDGGTGFDHCDGGDGTDTLQAGTCAEIVNVP